MKRVLSLILATLMVVSIAVVGVGAIKPSETETTVSKLADATYVDAATSANVSVAYNTYATVTTDAAGTSTRYLAVKFNGSYVISDYAYIAFRYRTTAAPGSFIDTIDVSTTTAAFGASGTAAASTYMTSTGYWETALIPLTTAALGANLNTAETLSEIKIPAPAVGKSIDIAWVGVFTSQAMAERYAAYYAAINEGGYYVASRTESHNFNAYTTGSNSIDNLPGFNDRWYCNYINNDFYGTVNEGQANGTFLRLGNPHDGLTDVSSLTHDTWYVDGTQINFSAQMKLTREDKNGFVGMMMNFGREKNDGVDSMYETYTSLSDGMAVVGNSGIGYALYGAALAGSFRIFVHTGGATLGTPIYADFNAADFIMNSYHEFRMVDDGDGTIEVTFGGLPVATIAYSNPQSVAGLNETYYRTVMMYDSQGTLKASTTEALVSTMKSVAIGQRGATVQVDDIALTVTGPTRPAIEIDPDAPATPTEITLAEGTTSYFKTLNSEKLLVVLPVKRTGFSSVRLAEVKASVNEADYIKVYNGATEITSTTANLKSGYTVSLEGGDSYTLVVMGDFDNNGRVVAADYSSLRALINQRAAGYTIAQFLAADASYTAAKFMSANYPNSARLNAASYSTLRAYIDTGSWSTN